MSNRKFPKIGVDTGASIAIEAIGEKNREIRQLRTQLAHANGLLTECSELIADNHLNNLGKLGNDHALSQRGQSLTKKILNFGYGPASYVDSQLAASERKLRTVTAARNPCCEAWETKPIHGIKTGDAEADRPVALKCDGCAGDDSKVRARNG
jgi:hypothetical protein